MHSGYGRRVFVPPTFRVRPPQTFARLIRWSATSTGDVAGLEGQWVRVSGAPLPVPVLVRIDRATDGRYIVTGLLIGHRDRREITWETLRSIKPSTIVSLIFSGWDPRNPAKLYADTDPAPPVAMDGADFDEEAYFAGEETEDDERVIDVTSPEWRAHMRALTALRLWEETRPGDERDTPDVTEVNKPRASVATNLTHFAEVYERHWASDPRRATTATARELHISRATAIRRIGECRQIGLLPAKEPRS